MAEALRSTPPEMPGRGAQPPRDAAVAVLDELPPDGTRHWVPRYKAAVVAAVDAGVLSLDDARRRYLLSEEEFESWRDTIDRYGVIGLRMSVTDRRAAPRLEAAEPGQAALSAGERVACTITDVSDRGARIEVDHKVSLPGLFELSCTASGRSWWVDLVWQRGQMAGVRFTNPLPPPWAIRSGLGAWLIGKRRTVSIDKVE